MDAYENEISPDTWIVSDVNADRDDDPAAYERKLRKKYDVVKRDVNGIDGMSIKAPDWATHAPRWLECFDLLIAQNIF